MKSRACAPLRYRRVLIKISIHVMNPADSMKSLGKVDVSGTIEELKKVS
jgi:hypothetical protein